MRDDALPYQPKPGKVLAFSSKSICQKWIPHEFDIVVMLANSGLCHPVLAFANFARSRHLAKRSWSDSSAYEAAQCPTGRRWFAFRECGWRNLFLCDIIERNSQTLAPNISAAASSYGMTM
jgi:hypothetical protein